MCTKNNLKSLLAVNRLSQLTKVLMTGILKNRKMHAKVILIYPIFADQKRRA
jgi:hypothetical protein